MHKSNVSVLLLLAVLTASVCQAQNLYRDFITGFSDISQFNSQDNYIFIDNSSPYTIFESYPFNVANATFTYRIWIKNNQSTSSTKGHFLRNHSAENFGLIWNFVDSCNFSGLHLRYIESVPYDDIHSRPYIDMTVFSISKGSRHVIANKQIENIFINDNWTSLKISYTGHLLQIDMGSKKLEQILSISNIKFLPECRIGYFIPSGNQLTIKRIQFDSKPIKALQFQTLWTKAALDSLFDNSKDPFEGYWTYYDRNMDERQMKLGGKYTIAIVRNNDAYDILYISGASFYPELWSPYTLKGRLLPAPFGGHYDLEWYDIEKNLIADEGYAYIDSNGILSLQMPVHNSEIRFYKITNSHR